MTNLVPQKPSAKFPLLWGLVIGGLLLFNLILFGSFFLNDQHTIKHLRFSLDYRHWPAWYSANLWLVVFGLILVLLLKTKRIQSGIKRFYASSFWRSGVRELQNSRWNRIVVCQFLRRKFSKRMLRRWIHYRQQLRIEHYDRYTIWCIMAGVLFVTFRYSDWLEPVRGFLFYRTGRWRYLIQWLYEGFYLAPLTSYLAEGTVTWRLFVVPALGLLTILWLLVSVWKLKKRRLRHDG